MTIHTEVVKSANGAPKKLLFVAHGVFGSGQNWRLFMRKVAEARPDWGFVLCDLRGHGRSADVAPDASRPDASRPDASRPDASRPTVADLASDLIAIENDFDAPVVGIVGHSLGGKVALAYAASKPGGLDQLWVLDSQPGATLPGGPALEVLTMLESLPATFDARADFVAAVEARGQSKAVAMWLAMNVKRVDGELRLSINLPVIRSVLDDYFQLDLWRELERSDERRVTRVVAGTKSYVWRDGDLARLDGMATERAHGGRLSVHRLVGAGHWVHVDAADALRSLFVAHL